MQTKQVTYTHDGVTFKGHLAWDDSLSNKRPGVLVVHEWWGLNDYAKKKAEQLASMGYVAFACDMYGDGKVTEHPQEAGKMATEVRKNLKSWQGRAEAALKVLQDHPQVDGDKLAAIGYCFGGSTCIQLAPRGAPLKAIVTFSRRAAGADARAGEGDQGQGADLPRRRRRSSRKKRFRISARRSTTPRRRLSDDLLRRRGAQLHGPRRRKAGVPGLAYHAEADRRSWNAMKFLFLEAVR